MLRRGDRGESVYELQEQLALAGYLDSEADGISAIKLMLQCFGSKRMPGYQWMHCWLRTWSALAQKVQSESYRTYVVAKGDTMYGIAKRFGVTVEAIAAASGVARPELIKPGRS